MIFPFFAQAPCLDNDNAHFFFVRRKPVPWAAHQGYGRHSYNPRQKEREEIQWDLKCQWQGRPLLDGCLEIFFTFLFAAPKSWSKRDREKLHDDFIPHTSQKDASNLIKMTEDCLKGIIISDDKINFKVHAEKYWSLEDKIVIVIVEHEMPLVKSSSKKAVGKNIKAELEAGKPLKQAQAIALDVQRRAKKKKK